MKKTQINNYLISFVVFIVLIYFNLFIWTAVGLSFFVFTAVRFFNNVGNTIDIRDLIILLPVIQWIVGPWLSYRFSTDDIFYYMIIEESQYMSFVVPATLTFNIGLYLSFSRKNNNLNHTLSNIQYFISKHKQLYIAFIIIGITANLLISIMPPSLIFFVFLIGNLQYVGLFMLQQNKSSKNKNFIFIGVIIIMTILALSRGMFQSLLLWFTFLFIIVSFINKTSIFKKSIIIISIFIVGVFIQSVKSEYRSIIWSEDESNETISETDVFSELIINRLNRTELLTSDKNINNLIARINQGWIIARVMNYTPIYEPFANGETIIDAISASLVPRFLVEDKKVAGGKENFTRFTGRGLVGGTSMNLSIIGEVYANFGVTGAILFMFVFGLFLNKFYVFIMGKLKIHPMLLFFIPLIFFQVVKAETDFGMVLNYLVKASVFVALIFWGLKTFYKIKM